jgi:uncharacterized protein (TIGR01244 family)
MSRIHTFLRRCGLAAAVLFAGAAAWAADGGTVEEIVNYVRVTQTVSTGGQPTAAQIQALGRAGFRAVLNLREDEEYDAKAEAAAAQDAGLIYLRIPVKGSDPRDVEADAFLRLTDDPANFPMFIHCAEGNRVGAFWLIRRVLRDGMTFDEAEAEARLIGLKSPNLVEFARGYVAAHAGERR